METFIIIVAFIFAFFAYESVNYRKKCEKELKERLEKGYGTRPDRKYEAKEYERIRFYFDSKSADNTIDDITWNDLSMDDIFKLFNHTYSSIGEEYLYDKLRRISFDKTDTEEINNKSNLLMKDKDLSMRLQGYYANMGRTKSVSFFDFIHKLTDLKSSSNLIHYACIFLTIASLGLFLFNASIAILAFVAMLIFDVAIYYSKKGQFSDSFVCVGYMVSMLKLTEKLIKENAYFYAEYKSELDELYDKLSFLKKNTFLIPNGNVNESLGSFIMVYLNMIFHFDLIKFNNLIVKTSKNAENIDRLYEILGRIELILAVSSVKTMLINEYGFVSDRGVSDSVEFKDIYHPMIKNAVKNSMQSEKAVLLTGSNASGKSTFLKTVAINTILSQTLGFACAKEFKVKDSFVMSSMALRDDLNNNESYYIVEIKSLKRIVDKAKGDITVMCFVDEVLRGTNTVERIAASSTILDMLSKENTICFAATHDIELTKLLEVNFKNYHFEEEVSNDDVLFNYELRIGPATTRNAIKLLKVLGYDSDIVTNATEKSVKFLESGVWL